MICDALENHSPVIYANRYFEYKTGYDTHDVLGRSWCVHVACSVYSPTPTLCLSESARVIRTCFPFT